MKQGASNLRAIFISLLAIALSAWQGAVAQTRVERTINSNWRFIKSADTSASNWEAISLPHSFNVNDVTDDGAGYYQGTTWYKKDLYLPAAWKGREVYLLFKGASQVATVYLNGKLLGEHIGGYTAFRFRLNEAAVFDDNTINHLAVKVDNSHNENIPPLSADFTFYGGIYRDVVLEAVNPVHFNMDDHASAGIYVNTPQVGAESASISISGEVTNAAGNARPLKIIQVLSDKDGKTIASVEQIIQASAGNTKWSQTISKVIRPQLWSPDHPYLYRLRSAIIDANSNMILDELVHPVGFRWFSFSGKEGLMLNGKHVKLWGASRHQDYWGMANALPEALHVKDIQLLKDMGANFLRVAHYPQDPALLEACDRLGIIASVETPVVNAITENETFAGNCLRMQTEMIRQNYNHPSIFIWAYMNEVLLRLRYTDDKPRQAIYIENVRKLAVRIDSLTRKEDPSRYTMLPCHGDLPLYTRAGLALVPQITGWNQYSGWYSDGIQNFGANMDRFHASYPDRPIIVTEFGADGDPRVHSFKPERFDKSLEYETWFHSVYIRDIAGRDFITGAAMWNLADFNAEGRAESMPHINNKGLLTMDRRPKEAYYYYQSRLLKTPFVKIGSGEWRYRSGNEDAVNAMHCTQPVTIISNHPSVTLTLNGKSLGSKQVVDGEAVFEVPFQDGLNILEAKAGAQSDRSEIHFLLQPADLASSLIPFKEINISLGDKRFMEDEQLAQCWLPEQPYKKGSWGYFGGEIFKLKDTRRQPYGSDKNIFQTELDPVYETQRVGLDSFRLDVPAGKYELTLLFAELLSNAIRDANVYNLDNGKMVEAQKPEDRTFDVIVNGQTVLNGLSNKTELIPETAFSAKFVVEVKGAEGLLIRFHPTRGQAILNGLQLRKIF